MAENSPNPVIAAAPYLAIIGAIWTFSQTYGGKIEKIDSINSRVEKLEGAEPSRANTAAQVVTISQRLDRIEDKLDRLVERAK